MNSHDIGVENFWKRWDKKYAKKKGLRKKIGYPVDSLGRRKR